ncbi:MAG TPA: signal peptidase II [Acidimicrobiaceae bacterium]|nr:signal peptidase II [Acidimicrobiaceae bacterium]
MTEADVSPGESRTSPSFLRWAVALAVVVVVVDQITKHWAVSSLPGRPPVHVIWTLQWNLAFNRGMAFSNGQGLGPVIGVLALVITAVVLRLVSRHGSRLAAVVGGLIAGGALGNVVDRLFRGDAWMRGAVVDFIDFQWFPIFNVADMAVNIGGALYVLWALFGTHDEVPQQKPDAA